jgi:hypothetical protein
MKVMSDQMFEKASRLNLMFETTKGLLNVTDLWRLPLTSSNGKVNLDDIAKALHVKLRDDVQISFVNADKAAVEPEDSLRFEIVKRIINVRLAEQKEEQSRCEKAAKKQQMQGILDQKEGETLMNLSLDELRKMIGEM